MLLMILPNTRGHILLPINSQQNVLANPQIKLQKIRLFADKCFKNVCSENETFDTENKCH